MARAARPEGAENAPLSLSLHFDLNHDGISLRRTSLPGILTTCLQVDENGESDAALRTIGVPSNKHRGRAPLPARQAADLAVWAGQCKWTFAALLVVVFASMLVVGCRSKSSTPKKVAPRTVSALKLEPETVRISREYVGRTDALMTVELRAQVTGYIRGYFFHEGQTVHKGQPLFQIDPALYRAQLDESAAQLARANADVLRAQAQVALAADAVSRYAPLAPINAIPRQQYADAVAQLQIRQAELQQMQATVQVAQAALEQAKVRLGYTLLRAPIAGVIGLRRLSPGALASAEDAQPLATISQSDPVRVTFAISDADYLRYIATAAGRDGRRLQYSLQLADGSTYPLPGRFYAVDRPANVQTDTVSLMLLFPNPGNRLRPGQYAKVRVALEERKDALLLPVTSVRESQGAQTIWVVGPNNVATERTVRAEQRVGNTYVVSTGVAAGDVVIVGGEQKLRPGDAVKPQMVSAKQLKENDNDAAIGTADPAQQAEPR